jgi:prevent-host-death family protein
MTALQNYFQAREYIEKGCSKILSQLENEKAPILITQHGRPAAYLVDVKTYDELQALKPR